MSSYTPHHRNLFSTWFSLIFFFLLVTYLISIEIFKESKSQKSIVTLLETPIRSDFVDNVIGIRFKNRIGSYTIKKEKQGWILQEPRVIPAQNETINKILNSLRSIKVHTIHQHEPINFQSFSLDNPIINMELMTKLDEKIELKVGLINPINNTSYMTVSGKDRIFQTNLFEGQLERLELSDFIDGRVFSINSKEIKTFSLYIGKETSPRNVLNFNGVNWKSKKYNTINDENVFKKVNSILNVKTHMILDEVDEELNQFIQNYLDNPLYRIKIELRNGRTYDYTVTSLVKAIKPLKIEKKQYFLMKASDRPYPYIISKNFLDSFKIRYKDLK